MRKLLIGCAFIASACGNSMPPASPVTVPDAATTTTELITVAPTPTTTSIQPVVATEPTTLTTTTTVMERQIVTVTTAEYLREQATTTVARRPVQDSSSGACGGSLPPCYVMQRESRGSLTVYNYEGSGASGKWQIMPGTWNGYGGYANAADAPESVQDAKARELWAGGRGCWHWDAC